MTALLAIVSALAAPGAPGELVEVPRRRLYRYRERPPIVLPVDALEPALPTCWCERPRGCTFFPPPRGDWQAEIRASVDEIR